MRPALLAEHLHTAHHFRTILVQSIPNLPEALYLRASTELFCPKRPLLRRIRYFSSGGSVPWHQSASFRDQDVLTAIRES
jgi:hypothetical protein